VAQYALPIAVVLTEHYGLSPLSVEKIGRFSRPHDIGKIGIPDAVLLKQGPLTAEERVVMNIHVDLGHHHQRLDGSGYPQG
jgi:HD-GYP domain-containing protein (c-di-GMP phosphodiesterase class II)